MDSSKSYQERQETKRYWRRLDAKLVVIFAPPIIAIAVVLFVFRLYHIVGSSMEPTLHSKETVLINKFDKYWAKKKGKAYTVNRYDVVVLKTSQESKTQVIKRVIGLPGDRIIIQNDNVIILNQQHPGGYFVDKEVPPGVTIDKKTAGNLDIKVGANEIFVLGDNRSISEDSRKYGPVKTEDIVGRHLFRVWPLF